MTTHRIFVRPSSCFAALAVMVGTIISLRATAVPLLFGTGMAVQEKAASEIPPPVAWDWARGSRTAAAKIILGEYLKAFCCDELGVCYGMRINTEKGIDVLEKPENIQKGLVKGMPTPWGYGAGIEDAPYQTGTLLYGLCEAYDATGDEVFYAAAKKIFEGMVRIGTIAKTPGFIPRGPHPDGKSYYADSSLDQHSLYMCGMWRYYKSKIADEKDKNKIKEIMDAVGKRLEKNKWFDLNEQNTAEAYAGGGDWKIISVQSSILLLSTVGAIMETTGLDHWEEVYEAFGNEQNGARWQKIAEGYVKSQDLPRYTRFSNQYIYRAMTLSRIEKDKTRKEYARNYCVDIAREMNGCNYFTHWRRTDFIGKRPESDMVVFLERIGLDVNKNHTIFDLWKACPEPQSMVYHKLPSDGKNRSYWYLCVETPVMVWGINVMVDDRELAEKALPYLDDVLKKIDLKTMDKGFLYNYLLNYALFSLKYDKPTETQRKK